MLSREKLNPEGLLPSDVHIKCEPPTDCLLLSDSNIFITCNETETKTEIKEEPVNRNATFIELKDKDLCSDAKSETVEDPLNKARLVSKTLRNCGSDDGADGCLKLDSMCEKSNANAVHGFINFKVRNIISKHKILFKCARCDQNFFTTPDLKIHSLFHKDDRLFKCDLCAKSFTRTEDIKAHSLIHRRGRPFICEVCDKNFSLSEHLKAHNMIHEEQRPFKCDVCNKGFIRHGHLKAHNLIHSRNRPFKCDMCDKSFIWFEHLKAHNLIHDTKRRFKCDLCNKSYIHLEDLKAHSLIHQGSDGCDKSYTQPCHVETQN